MSNHIGDRPVDECTNAIIEKLARFFPFKSKFPSTDVRVKLGTATIQDMIHVRWIITVQQILPDFERFLFTEDGLSQEDPDAPAVVTIGSETLMNPCYVLYSVVQERMLKCVFDTKTEAMLYARCEKLGYYPVQIKSKIAEDPWYDPEDHRGPLSFGIRDIKLDVRLPNNSTLIVEA